MKKSILIPLILLISSCEYRDPNPIKEQQIPQSNDAFNNSAELKEDSALDFGQSFSDTSLNIKEQISSLKNNNINEKYIADSIENSINDSKYQNSAVSNNKDIVKQKNSYSNSNIKLPRKNITTRSNEKQNNRIVISEDTFAEQFQGFNNSIVLDEKKTIKENKYNERGDYNISAIIPEKCLVANGGTIKMKSLERVKIGNYVLESSSTITGRATLSNDRMYIVIQSLNVNGSIKNVDLNVYDLDGAEGISIPGINIKKKTSKGLGGVINTAGSILTRGNTVTSQLSSNLVRSVTSGNIETITIPGGKKLIIKSNN